MKSLRLTTLFLLMMAVTGGVVTACRIDHPGKADPSNVIKQTRQVGTFTGIRVGGAFEVIVKQGPVQEVVVETESDVIEYVTTEVSGGVLEIGFRKSPPHWMHDIDVLKVYVTCKDLDMLDLSGAVEISSDGKITTPKLEMDVSGAVESKLDLAAQVLNLDISGASELTFSGTAGEMRVDASGASELSAYDMMVTNLTLYGSGAIESKVNVSGSLKANMSGACSVRYKGNPRIEAHSSGASDIKRAD
jgi:hypothetical protein